MTIILVFLVLAGLLLALFWLLFGKRPQKDPAQAALEIQQLLPVHCKHFVQIQQVLKTCDQVFIEQRLPKDITKKWRGERREVVRLYIRGLRQDFRGLEQLARSLAALSPKVNRKQEWEWAWLGIQFRLLYVFTELQFAAHNVPLQGLTNLTEMLMGLRMMLENTINEMSEPFQQTQRTLAS